MQEKVSKFLKKSFRALFYTGTVTALGYSYLYYLSKQSLEDYQNSLSSLKPNPTNSFNSSDLVYMKHACIKSFTPTHTLKCLIHHRYKNRVINTNRAQKYRQSSFDSVGIVSSHNNSKRVVFYYYDQLMDLPLDEFLALPYFSEIYHSKFTSKLEKVDEVTEEFRAKLHHAQKVLDNSWPVRTEGIVRDGVDIVLNLWVSLGISKPEKMLTMLRQTVGDIETNNNGLFSEDYCDFSTPEPIKSN